MACQRSLSVQGGTVPVKMLHVDPPGPRKQFGLEEETSEKDKQKIKKNMLGKNQLNANAFPAITYKSVSFSATSGKVEVTGDLEIRGVTRRITTVLDIREDGKTFQAKDSFSVMHTDFGSKPYTALFGMIRNDNTLNFYIDVVGNPVSSQANAWKRSLFSLSPSTFITKEGISLNSHAPFCFL